MSVQFSNHIQVQHLEYSRKEDYVYRLITMVYHRDPGSKQEAEKWCYLGILVRRPGKIQK